MCIVWYRQRRLGREIFPGAFLLFRREGMCTVFGYNGSALSAEKVKAALEKTVSRGPDMERIMMLPEGDGFLAFQRLAIMGLDESGMQPFVSGQDAVVCNGEIYGFWTIREELRKRGYKFVSGSDCEVLLPLWREYGEKMFAMLDAEYAMILYDSASHSFVAARDPIGIRPLFYGYAPEGGIFFASEARMLMGLVDHVIPFPPGTYYRNGEFHRYRDIAGHEGDYIRDSIETITASIRTRLEKAVEKRLDSDAPLGFLLSGGLDSSLVCSIAASKLSRPIRTFAIGMEKDAIDLKYAKETADYLGADHTEVYMTPRDVIGALEEVIYCLGTYDITTIRASMGMFLLCRAIHERSDVRVLLTGEVSDELFGYKYTDFAPSPEEFQKESEKRVRELYAYDVLRADRCIADNSIEARVPFGDLDFVSYVMSIDPAVKMNTYGKGKYLLRKAFDDGRTLPDNILWREKAAFSDAVGHSMVDDLKAYAHEVYGGQDWQAMCAQYPEEGRPFTEESLLYRTIFEKYYPGQSAMIPGFWMPNRTWKGCDVSDPSARVLSNYGASGI